jgi:uncharacterized membrane protein
VENNNSLPKTYGTLSITMGAVSLVCGIVAGMTSFTAFGVVSIVAGLGYLAFLSTRKDSGSEG